MRQTVDTPLGPVTLQARGGSLCRLQLPGSPDADPGSPDPHPGNDAAITKAAEQIAEYFAGERTAFELDLAPAAGTPFQHRVWQELQAIPHGAIRTYAQVAASVGRPGAARAVGQANRINPLPIVVPCHRVVASDGLGGYQGSSGIDRKRWLLRHEGVSAL